MPPAVVLDPEDTVLFIATDAVLIGNLDDPVLSIIGDEEFRLTMEPLLERGGGCNANVGGGSILGPCKPPGVERNATSSGA